MASIAFGLEAQGKIPLVEKLLAEGKSWNEIARAVGWAAPDAVRSSYGRYLRRNGLQGATGRLEAHQAAAGGKPPSQRRAGAMMGADKAEHLKQVASMDFAAFWEFADRSYGQGPRLHSQEGREQEIWEHRTDSSWLWSRCDEIHTLVFYPENWDFG